MAEGKYPQIVSAMETKLHDFKQYKSIDNRLNNARIKLGAQTDYSTKSFSELRGETSRTKITHETQKININHNMCKRIQNKIPNR